MQSEFPCSTLRRFLAQFYIMYMYYVYHVAMASAISKNRCARRCILPLSTTLASAAACGAGEPVTLTVVGRSQISDRSFGHRRVYTRAALRSTRQVVCSCKV